MILEIKMWIVPIAAFIPLIMGFIWYNPKVLGTIWMKEAGLNEESIKGANMPLIFGLSYVFANLVGAGLLSLTIHQMGFQSMIMNHLEAGDPEFKSLAIDFLAKYGNDFRTFGHGAIHGVLAGIMLALPILATNSMFDRRSWKYIWINVGYWTISMALMGGVICQFA